MPLFLRAALSAAAAAALVASTSFVLRSAASTFALAGGCRPLAASSERASAVAMRLSPYHGQADRERLARQYKETRIKCRQQAPRTLKLNYDMLPPVEDIYNRRYSGNATVDPVGGRKRYTFHVLMKEGVKIAGADATKAIIYDYIKFMKFKMSCTRIEAVLKKSPIDNQAVTTLEYPMKEYGEVARGQASKDIFNKATWVEFNLYAPIAALDYIKAKFHGDNNILRLMVLGHTRSFKGVHEDNELHL